MLKFVKMVGTDGLEVFINIANITTVSDQGEHKNTLINTVDPDDCVFTEMPLQRVMQEIRAAQLAD